MTGCELRKIIQHKDKGLWSAVCSCGWDSLLTGAIPKKDSDARKIWKDHIHGFDDALELDWKDAIINLRDAGLL